MRRNYKFHHEIHTDGVTASLLFFSKEGELQREKRKQKQCNDDPPSRSVGLDPGKKNMATITHENSITVQYSSRQRNFKSKLTRYRWILNKEKKEAGVEDFIKIQFKNQQF